MIVGAGHAGFQSAATLRQRGYEGTIALVAGERGLPYQRPPLSKELLHGETAPDAVAFRPAAFYDKKGIELRAGDPVEGIDRAARHVELRSGTQLAYEQLVIATGARNRELPVPGTHLDGVLALRSLTDAQALAERLGSARSIAVIGGGFIGLEVAAAASHHGVQVTVVETLERTMARVVSPLMAAHVTGVHERHGATVMLGARAVALLDDGDGRVAGVELEDGSRVEADVVVVAVGIVPEVELADAAGLALEDGIVVDEQLRTEDPAIWAIGDCAAFPLPNGGARVRLESVQNAADHARTAAAGILGSATAYDATPWFWTNQHSCRVQIAGLVAGHDEAVVRGDESSGAFSVFCFRAGELLGVESVNAPRDHLAARKLLAARTTLSRDQAADPAFDLKALAATGQPDAGV